VVEKEDINTLKRNLLKEPPEEFSKETDTKPYIPQNAENTAQPEKFRTPYRKGYPQSKETAYNKPAAFYVKSPQKPAEKFEEQPPATKPQEQPPKNRGWATNPPKSSVKAPAGGIGRGKPVNTRNPDPAHNKFSLLVDESTH